MRLKIELLSDLCVSSGETYNAYVDTDVVYDEYGLPFIPAKRIKGCIREAALELVEWGVYTKEQYEALFGKAGKERTLFSLDNAYPEGYEEYVSDLSECGDRSLTQPQRVLSLFSYTRTQTAMTEDGVADKGSLRTVRVVNKGLVFQACMRENIKLTDSQKQLLTDAVSMVKHIGSNRTRGLGLVEMSLFEEDCSKQNEVVAYEYGERNKIFYSVFLKSPMICKSAEGSQEKTHDYIDGSKIIGVLAQSLPREEFAELMHYDGQGESIIVSNAYICKGGERCTPVRASLQKVKDQTYDDKGELTVADMLLSRNDEVQWTPLGNGYVSGAGYMKEVDVETNYHHSRPTDKSVGKATGEDDSSFYQLQSIRKGQRFSGFILADRKQAPVIVKVLSELEGVRMGYGRNAEYGNVELAVTGVEPVSGGEARLRDSFVVKLNSAAILYNENGVPSADIAVLKTYIAEALQTESDNLRVNSAFLTYETIGGYNVTWNSRKPIFTALGKGTVCYITASEQVDVARLEQAFVGERIAEGYGEVEVSDAPVPDVVLKKNMATGLAEATGETVLPENGPADAEPRKILVRLTRVKLQDEVSSAGNRGATELIKNQTSLLKKGEFDAAFSKLRMIVKSETGLKGIRDQVAGIESDSKREICQKLLKPVEKYVGGASTAIEQLGADEVTRIYLYSFMNQIKYEAYKQKKGGTK